MPVTFLHCDRTGKRPEHVTGFKMPDEQTYYKEDAGILVGAFELEAKPWGMDGIDENFCFDQLPEDLDHFEPILEKVPNRIPTLESYGIQTFFNGPKLYTRQ